MSSGFISIIGTSAKSIVPLMRLSLSLAREGCALPLLVVPDMVSVRRLLSVPT